MEEVERNVKEWVRRSRRGQVGSEGVLTQEEQRECRGAVTHCRYFFTRKKTKLRWRSGESS